jgi:signal transduction histidine kinase
MHARHRRKLLRLSNGRGGSSRYDHLQRRRSHLRDSDLFERVLGNLLDNALRFTPENGSIQIALSERDSDFEVAVSDTGRE